MLHVHKTDNVVKANVRMVVAKLVFLRDNQEPFATDTRIVPEKEN